VSRDRELDDRGQASVEFAMALPLVAVLILGVVQVVLVARDQLTVELAAREGARAAAVAAAPSAAARRAVDASTELTPLGVHTRTSSGNVSVTVTHRNPTNVPILGALIASVDLTATVTMAREPP
jgi:Flp pilus assembly protein TadG